MGRITLSERGAASAPNSVHARLRTVQPRARRRRNLVWMLSVDGIEAEHGRAMRLRVVFTQPLRHVARDFCRLR